MRVRPVSLTPRVARLPEHFRNDIAIETGWLTLELTTAEALALADQLHDKSEEIQ